MNAPLSVPTPPATVRPAFTWRERKNGEVAVLHHGRLASVLRGAPAREFVARMAVVSTADGQQLMARVTGNYKRGNERTAGSHARNGC